MFGRVAKIILGVVIVIAGIILTPLPIPFGILLILVGLSILVSAIPAMRSWLVAMRKRYSETSHKLNNIKPHMPRFLRRLIEDTDPDQTPHSTPK